MKKYKRSKVDSVLYCPYCGHGFRMNEERYKEQHKAQRENRYWSVTSCFNCNKKFNFRNLTTKSVHAGLRAVKKLEEV